MENQIGPYRLLRKISRGGMGSVYEAIHEAIERRVAIKILDAESARNSDSTTRFLNEARAVNRVNDPGLVQMFDHGILPNGTAYIVMEYLDGETLAHRLRRSRQRMPVPEILRLLRQTAATLAATHKKGIVHRDLKPANIMVVADTAVPGGERTKLLDFGIAKLRESSPIKAANTHKDLLMGTPSYMSPEQCRGAGGVDEKTDVYSLGVVLYRALAGRLPFMAGGAGDIMAQHIYQPAPALGELAPWLPSSLTELVHRLISKDKEQRPTMAEVVAELDRLAGELAEFKLPELPRDPSLSAELDGLVDSRPGVEHAPDGDEDDEEDAVAETMGVGETPAMGVELLSNVTSPSSTGRRLASSPSQLSWSISNTGRPARISGTSGWLVLGLLIAVASVGSGLWLTGRLWRPVAKVASPGPTVAPQSAAGSEAAPPAAGAAPSAASTAAAATVEWILETTPPGAEILRISDRKLLGRTPWHGEVASGSGTEELRLSLAGHVERLVNISRSSDVRRRFTLVPSGAAAPAASGKDAHSPGKSRGKNRKKGHVKIEFED